MQSAVAELEVSCTRDFDLHLAPLRDQWECSETNCLALTHFILFNGDLL